MKSLVGVFLVISFCLVSGEAFSELITSKATGKWGEATTWDPRIPIDGDDIIILATHTVTVEDPNNPGFGMRNVILNNVNIEIHGALKFDRYWGEWLWIYPDLILDAASQIAVMDPNGVIHSVQGSGWSRLEIGGGSIWDGNDGDVPNGQLLTVGGAGPIPGAYVPLPIELIYFNAQSSQDQVELTWSTASELNNDFFTLEKSKNGRDFVKIEEVGGMGTTNIQADYSYTHPSPYLGMSYYRLSQTDYDGTTEVFPVVSVLFEGKKSFRVGPNPVNGSNFKLIASQMGNQEIVELNIIDLQGRLVERKQIRTDNFGNVDTEIQLQKPLRKGTYFFKLTSPSRKEYIKVAAE